MNILLGGNLGGNLGGKVALVTGASRGIGRAVALELGRAGADVAVTARSEAELEAVAEELRAMGRRALALPCDALSRPSIVTVVERAVAELGPVSILVNNAGITQGVKFSDQSPELWERIVGLNLSAAMHLCQLTVPAMAAAGWGRVVNVASVAARTGLRYSAAYTASKHGLLGLTRSLALDYATRGVTVNAVCPGWVRTEMVEDTVRNIVEKTGRSREEAIASLVSTSAQGRLIEPEEVAAAVVFLASEMARGITGQGLNVDGGTVLS